MTTVHKGGLFGSDYRMLLPGRRHRRASSASSSTRSWSTGKRGLACQPAIVGVGIGGAKDTCVRLGKEAACLRTVGSRNPDPEIARLEDELTALGNYIGIGAMGFAGTSLVVATHVEVAYTHTGRHAGRHPPVLPVLPPRHRAHPRRTGAWTSAATPAGSPTTTGARGSSDGVAIARLDDVAWTRCMLTTPVGEADLARLKLGDVVYLSGVLYTAREGVYRKVVDEGHGVPGRGAGADQRQLPLLAGGERRGRTAPTRWRRSRPPPRFRFGKSMSRVVRALGRARSSSARPGSPSWPIASGSSPTAPSTSRRSATASARPTGVRSRACSTCTGCASWASPRRCGCSRSSGSARSWWRATREGRSLFALANREINLRLARGLREPAALRAGPLRRDHRPHRRGRLAGGQVLKYDIFSAVFSPNVVIQDLTPSRDLSAESRAAAEKMPRVMRARASAARRS